MTLTCHPYCITFPFYNIETLKSNDVLYRCFLFEGYCVFWLGCGVSSSEQTRYQLKNVHNQITLDASRINWYVIDSSRLHSVDLISMTLSLQLYKHYLYTGYISAKRCTLMSSNLIHSFVITVEVAGKVLLYLKKQSDHGYWRMRVWSRVRILINMEVNVKGVVYILRDRNI